jgi:hypothetical protein
MCYDDEYLRRLRAQRESRELWHDFERTQPVADTEPPAEEAGPEREEVLETREL